ncbi:hypothetical protein [Plastoroseomonas arctica]|uniref:ACT domain-containing protein n=1 Tax=Plastoroseomonas arctica TaxID=1509237 RepID=A0AAF1KL19_9PROT|nr:hypothetical protein [Plastoroseomonas arctica]MBR0657285.1 hypothetical protein [Plastoroseomonas arctica]
MPDTVLLTARFRVLADAEPGLLTRLLMAFAKRDLTPDLVTARREGSALRVEIACVMAADDVHRVEGNLGQVVGVRRLETEEGAIRRVA